MSYKSILYAVDNHVATLRLNRPAALNAMSVELMEEVNDAFARAADDAAVRVVVLTGEGRGFCSGADLAANMSNPPRDADGQLDLGHMLETKYNPLILKMRSMRQPVIAAVNGIAAGAGCSLALMADLTIAARSAKFLQAFVNVGLIPDAGATWLLPHTAGAQRAMGMSLLGEKISAEQARDWGLIWEVVDDEHLQARAQELAQRIAHGPGIAVERIKRSLYAAAANDLPTQLALEVALQRECGRSQDFMEGAMAFLQKRKANFKNR